MYILSNFIVIHFLLRIGVAFSVNPDKTATGFTDAGVALVRAYNFISLNLHNPGKGISFITDVCLYLANAY